MKLLQLLRKAIQSPDELGKTPSLPSPPTLDQLGYTFRAELKLH